MVNSAGVLAPVRKYLQTLRTEQARTLAGSVLRQCHQADPSRLEEGGVVKGSHGYSYQVDFDNGYEADQVIFSKVLRIGPIVFSSVLFTEPAEIAAEIGRQGASFSEPGSAGNIVPAMPSGYGFLSSLPINPHVHDLTAHMLSERAAFRGAKWAVDLGAGDGLLARIALRLGAERALLVENEPEPLGQARAFCRATVMRWTGTI